MKESTVWYIMGMVCTFVAIVSFNKSGWYSRDEIDY